MATPPETPSLRRAITAPMLTLFILGDVLGLASMHWQSPSPDVSAEPSGHPC